MDISIAAWLKDKRQAAGLDLRKLAGIAGTNKGQISRIETESTSITMNFLVVLLWALKVDADEFVSTFGLPPILPSDQSMEDWPHQRQESGTIRPAIVTQFVEKFENKIPQAIQILAKELGEAFKKAPSPLLFQDDLEERLQKAVLHGELLPNPTDLTIEMLSKFYADGGVITLADAGNFVRLYRQKLQLSLDDLAKLSQSTKSTLGRLENGQSDRIMLNDFARLDKALDAGGQVFSMYWVVAQLEMGVYPTTGELQARVIRQAQINYLGDTFVKVTRWSYVYDDPQLLWAVRTAMDDDLLMFFEKYSTEQKVVEYDIPALATEIYFMIPGVFFMYEEGNYERTPRMEVGLQIWEEIKKAIGNDVFGLRMLRLVRKNYKDTTYISGFQVLLRELLLADSVFHDKMLKIVQISDKNLKDSTWYKT